MEFQKKTQKWKLQNPLDPEFDEQTHGVALARFLQIPKFCEKPRESLGRIDQRIKKQLVQNASRGTCERFNAPELSRDRLCGNVETWKRFESIGAREKDACD